MVEKTSQTLDVVGCSAFLFDRTNQELPAIASHGLSEHYLSKIPFYADKSISEVLQGKINMVSYACTDSRLQYPDAARLEAIACTLSLPLRLEHTVAGALSAYSSDETQFSNEAIAFVRTLCDKFTLIIQEALRFKAIEDGHECITKDVWRWFNIGPVLCGEKCCGVQRPPSAIRRIRPF